MPAGSRGPMSRREPGSTIWSGPWRSSESSGPKYPAWALSMANGRDVARRPVVGDLRSRYLGTDAPVEPVRQGGRVVNELAVIATSTSADGVGWALGSTSRPWGPQNSGRPFCLHSSPRGPPGRRCRLRLVAGQSNTRGPRRSRSSCRSTGERFPACHARPAPSGTPRRLGASALGHPTDAMMPVVERPGRRGTRTTSPPQLATSFAPTTSSTL